jgi:hypothetical protein
MRTPPLKDAQGKIIPHNHPEIRDDHHVIRHITIRDLHREGEGKRVASGAYSESGDDIGGMSVDIEEWMIEDGLDSLHYVVNSTDGARRIEVGELRRLGFQVCWVPEPGNPHHGAVWGIGNGSKRKKRIAKIAGLVRKADGET